MLRLLRTDLKRIIKDKLLLITIFIGLGFAIIMPAVYKLIVGIMADAIEESEPIPGFTMSLYYSKTLFVSAFGLSNNFGLIMVILISIIICKDFSYGTIRNKIISGNSRQNIYLSLFLATAISLCLLMLVYSLITLGVSSIFFEYSPNGFNSTEFVYFLETIGFEMLVFIMVAALVTFLSVSVKNSGLTIVIYVGAILFFTLIGTIIAMSTGVLESVDEASKTNELINNIMRFIPFYGTATMIGVSDKYKLIDVFALLFDTIGYGALLYFIGFLIFKKKDIK